MALAVAMAFRAKSSGATHHEQLQCDVLERIKKAFDAAGIGIPFPQRDVHLYHHAQVARATSCASTTRLRPVALAS